MSTNLIRYWLEFEKTQDTLPAGLQIGCGVTAFTYEDALTIIATKIFCNRPLPKITARIDNVDIRNLDQGHVIPNMWTPTFRGIWFPMGHQDYVDRQLS